MDANQKAEERPTDEIHGQPVEELDAPTVSGVEDTRPLSETLDPEEYKRIERRMRLKLDIQIVPLCLMLYFLSFLDRTNIAQAKVSGMAEALFKPNLPEVMSRDYMLALVVLYPPYIVLEIPSNLLLKRIGPRFWIPLLVVIWGLVSTLQGIVKSRDGLLINRAFLGAAEAGILPGIAVYLTFFYKPRELQLRQALFFTGATLSGAFSGLLAVAIKKMEGMKGIAGWSWIFILEGLFTIVFGLLCILILPNGPEKSWWLSDIERRMAIERLESQASRYEDHEQLKEKIAQAEYGEVNPNETERKAPTRKLWLRDTLRTFIDPNLLLLCVAGFCCALPVYSVSYFSPTIIRGILDSPSSTHAQLMSCPPFAVAFVYGVAIAFVSDYFQLRFITAFPGMILTVVGFAIVYASHHVCSFFSPSL